MKKLKVYIASPYTVGDTAINVKKQMDCTSLLLDLGFIPFAPLLTHFVHMFHPKPYKVWMDYDFEWVKSCDFLLRLQGQSAGADMEIKAAESNDIPVFRDIENLLTWTNKIGYDLGADFSMKWVINEFSKINKLDV